jgi:hypothetical protein
MMSQKRSQLKTRNKEVTQMATQIRRMEMLMINRYLRSGRWSFVTMMEGKPLSVQAEKAFPTYPSARDYQLRWDKEDTPSLSNAVGGVSAHYGG